MTKLEKFEYARDVLRWTCDENGNVFNKNEKKIGTKKQGYYRTGIRRYDKTYEIVLHQFIFWFFVNELANTIDHIDGNTYNNSIRNLRSVNPRQNAYNRVRAKGYYKMRNKFRVTIQIDGKKKHIGYFETESEAYNAYLKAKEKYHII